MSPKTGKRKHVPQRTCVGCRMVIPKRSLIRIVRRPEGVQVDPTGKLAGRGAYLHNMRSCWEKGLRGSLANALKIEFTPTDREYLHAYMLNVPEDVETQSEKAIITETEDGGNKQESKQ